MTQGRPDFWYGQVLLLTNYPTVGDENNAPTANWAALHAAYTDAHHTAFVSADAAALIATHAADDDAHHEVYEQSNADTDIETHRTTATHTQNQPSDHATPIATHAADASAHHAKYTDGEVDARIALHVAEADPHTQYQKESEKNVANGYPALDASGFIIGPAESINLVRNGSGWLGMGDQTSSEGVFFAQRIGVKDWTLYTNQDGAAMEILTAAHVAAADPHTQYQKESEKDAVSGYAALDGSGHLLVKGNYIKIARTGSDNVSFYERTSEEPMMYFHREGADDFYAMMNEAAGYARVVTRGSIIIDRGDLNGHDIARTDLTCDGTWNDLNLSSIVPAGAVAIHLRLWGNPAAAGDTLQLRKNGFSYDDNVSELYGQVSGVAIAADVLQYCDSSRVIEYMVPTGDWTNLYIDVRGWVF